MSNETQTATRNGAGGLQGQSNGAMVKAPPKLVDMRAEALARPPRGAGDIKALFADPRTQASMAALLPKHLTPDRMLRVAVSNITKTPQLLQCTQISLLQSVMVLGELGLEPGGALGLAYLVPYGGTCTPIIGYRGFIELARRSGTLTQIEARVVHAKDKFTLKYGLEPKLEHEPSDAADPGAPLLAYCIARFKDGSFHVETMSFAQIEAVRARSKSGKGKSSPWLTDWEEMAKKTVLRRAAKWLPLSPEVARGMEADGAQFATVEGQVVNREGTGLNLEGMLEVATSGDFDDREPAPGQRPPPAPNVAQAPAQAAEDAEFDPVTGEVPDLEAQADQLEAEQASVPPPPPAPVPPPEPPKPTHPPIGSTEYGEWLLAQIATAAEAKDEALLKRCSTLQGNAPKEMQQGIVQAYLKARKAVKAT